MTAWKYTVVGCPYGDCECCFSSVGESVPATTDRHRGWALCDACATVLDDMDREYGDDEDLGG